MPFNFVIAGGVACNKAIRTTLQQLCQKNSFNFICPEPKLCTDNAAMVAWAGIEHYEAGLFDGLDFTAKARWRLDENSKPLVGFGKKGAKV